MPFKSPSRGTMAHGLRNSSSLYSLHELNKELPSAPLTKSKSSTYTFAQLNKELPPLPTSEVENPFSDPPRSQPLTPYAEEPEEWTYVREYAIPDHEVKVLRWEDGKDEFLLCIKGGNFVIKMRSLKKGEGKTESEKDGGTASSSEESSGKMDFALAERLELCERRWTFESLLG